MQHLPALCRTNRAGWEESDLEQALIDRLRHFLLELGSDLFFVARQKRLRMGDEDYYVDLVFYHRVLRCFRLVDLKVGKLAQQDLGQMLGYLGWFEEHETREGEGPPVGLVLGTDKNDTLGGSTVHGLRSAPSFAASARCPLLPPTDAGIP